MKKILAGIAAMYLLLFFCIIKTELPYGDTIKQTEDRVVLHVWIHKGLTNLPLLQEAAQEEFGPRGIAILFHEYDAGSAMHNLQLDTTLIADGNVDVYFTHTTQNLSKRIYAGCALNLSELCTQDAWDMETLLPSSVQALYHDGAPYSVPASIGKMGIILNKDMFDAAGIEVPASWTFDEFRAVAKRLATAETYGVYWNTNHNVSEALLHLVLPTLGGDPLYKNGGSETNFDDPVIAGALQLIYDTMHEDGSAPTHEDSFIQNYSMTDMFLSGQCAMTVGSWLFSEVIHDDTYKRDFVTAFAPWPVIESGRHNYTQGSLGLHLSINPKSDSINEAWEFVKWYVEKGSSLFIAEGYIPSALTYDASYIEEELLKNTAGIIDRDSAVALFLNPDDNLSIPTMSHKITEITKVFDLAVEDVLVGKKPLETALYDAKIEADGYL